jgi:hypothetical protein
MTETIMITKIYSEWLSLRRRIGKTGSQTVSENRKRIILRALASHEGEEIVLLMRYLRLSNDYYATFMRGQNYRNRDYTDFISIFRPTMLEDKIEKALNWDSKNVSYKEEVFFPFQIVGGG